VDFDFDVVVLFIGGAAFAVAADVAGFLGFDFD